MGNDSTPAASAIPAEPLMRKTATGTTWPCRRSSSQPNKAIESRAARA
jgi:hypothetical protein